MRPWLATAFSRLYLVAVWHFRSQCSCLLWQKQVWALWTRLNAHFISPCALVTLMTPPVLCYLWIMWLTPLLDFELLGNTDSVCFCLSLTDLCLKHLAHCLAQSRRLIVICGWKYVVGEGSKQSTWVWSFTTFSLCKTLDKFLSFQFPRTRLPSLFSESAQELSPSFHLPSRPWSCLRAFCTCSLCLKHFSSLLPDPSGVRNALLSFPERWDSPVLNLDTSAPPGILHLFVWLMNECWSHWLDANMY